MHTRSANLPPRIVELGTAVPLSCTPNRISSLISSSLAGSIPGSPERRFRCVSHRLPYRPLAHPLQVIHGVVHHAMTEPAHLVPVFRIQGFLGRHAGIVREVRSSCPARRGRDRPLAAT